MLLVSATPYVLLHVDPFQNSELHRVDWMSLIHKNEKYFGSSPRYTSIYDLESVVDKEVDNVSNMGQAAELVMDQYKAAASRLLNGE